jgi:hypothetical protein
LRSNVDISAGALEQRGPTLHKHLAGTGYQLMHLPLDMRFD